MEIIIVSNYYFPEIGAASNRIKNLSESFCGLYKKVNVICPMPNYPTGKIFDGYKNKAFIKEGKNNINIFRYWIYPSKSKYLLSRAVSMLSFALTLWFFILRFNRIKNSKWVVIQNSPLLVSFSAIILFKFILRKKIALNVSDLWPLSGYLLGILKKGKMYSLFENIEKFNYTYSDLILGQSNEILEHIKQLSKVDTFLYRNLQKNTLKPSIKYSKNNKQITLIYAGLLGVAQGVLKLIQNVNFRELNVELHLYGEGNELVKIKNYISENPEIGVIYKGLRTKTELNKLYTSYDAAIVPLKTAIFGAVPSKIFELISMGVPVLFSGNGEAADLVKSWKVGFVSSSNDFDKLKRNILKIQNMNEKEYRNIVENCEKVTRMYLNYENQINLLNKALS